MNKTAVVISGCWPGDKKGYEIACNSTLAFYSMYYTNIIYLGPEDEHLDLKFKMLYSNVDFVKLDFFRQSKPIRFLKSILSSYPAICMRFKRSESLVVSLIKNLNVRDIDFIYEDIPTGYFLKSLKRTFPDSRHIVRSHNTVYKGFYEMMFQGDVFSRLSWMMELYKIKVLEKHLASKADLFIAISNDDKLYYADIGIFVNDVLGVFLNDDLSIDNACKPAEVNNLIHIGTADLRKGSSLDYFVNYIWPKINTSFPNIKFYIAGRGTNKYNNPENNVISLGFIENENILFNKGSVFINPQDCGAGIKIKSIVALRNHCCLVSTKVGVEGIGLVNNQHVVVCDNIDEMEFAIKMLLNDTHEIQRFSDNGFNFYINSFSKSAFFSKAYDIWGKLSS